MLRRPTPRLLALALLSIPLAGSAFGEVVIVHPTFVGGAFHVTGSSSWPGGSDTADLAFAASGTTVTGTGSTGSGLVSFQVEGEADFTAVLSSGALGSFAFSTNSTFVNACGGSCFVDIFSEAIGVQIHLDQPVETWSLDSICGGTFTPITGERFDLEFSYYSPGVYQLDFFHQVNTGCGAYFSSLFTLPTLWYWREPGAGGDNNVMSSPAVMDLDGDCLPEVIFASTSNNGGADVQSGFLRALRGTDGTQLWASYTISVGLGSHPAVADIDHDLHPEIIVSNASGTRLLCFNHNGTLRWESDPVEPIGLGGASIADLGGNGTVEIVIGRQALSSTGQLLWTGSGGRGQNYASSPLSAVADITGDGVVEVIAGNTAYTSSGTVLWSAACPDGYAAVGQLEGDALPEIALCSGTTLRRLEANGAIAWSVNVGSSGGLLSPPCLVDLTGDGLCEIVVSNIHSVRAYSAEGRMLWNQAGHFDPSSIAGCIAADVDGDGWSEILVRDHDALSVLGAYGDVMHRLPMTSGTGTENPVVADLNGDGDIEIIVPSNRNTFSTGGSNGVWAFNPSNAGPGRRVWNQSGYHGTNVTNDGRVPRYEATPTNYRTAPTTIGSLRFADFNGDCSVDAADLAILLASWGGSGVADVDLDGDVDAADLSQLLAAWTG